MYKVHKETPPVVLTIAGSDSSAGAGIQADLKTITAIGGYATTVITALTAQNTQTVIAIEETSATLVEKQFQSIIEDFNIKAIKTGMLPNTNIVRIVSDYIRSLGDIPYILDPVICSTSGNMLVSQDTYSTIKQYLFPLATLVTPNIPETLHLLNLNNTNAEIRTFEDLKIIAKKFFDNMEAFGIKNVLVKGGHLNNCHQEEKPVISDIFLSRDLNLCSANENNDIQYERHYIHPRINTKNTHGTGCTLSAAIATYLAFGETLLEAIEKAENYVFKAIDQAKNLNLGHGYGPLWHFIKD